MCTPAREGAAAVPIPPSPWQALHDWTSKIVLPFAASGSARVTLAAASDVPARIAGRPELGKLEPGSAADVVVLDDGLEIVRVLAAGVDATG